MNFPNHAAVAQLLHLIAEHHQKPPCDPLLMVCKMRFVKSVMGRPNNSVVFLVCCAFVFFAQ
jgi:hypothetical protein